MWHMDSPVVALRFSCSNGMWVHWVSPCLEFSWRSANWPRRISFRMLDYLGWLPVTHPPTCWTEHPSRWLTEESKSGRGDVQVLFQARVGTAVANIPLVKKVTWPNSHSQVGKTLPPGRRKYKVTLQRGWMQRGKKIWGHPPLGLNKWSSDKEGVHNSKRHIATPVFIAVLFTKARTWKQPKCPLTDEWIKKMWSSIQWNITWP